MVRDAWPQMLTVYCVAAISLPYDTNKTTDKDIVLTHTQYSKELQVMNCNQLSLCRLRYAVANYGKCSF